MARQGPAALPHSVSLATSSEPVRAHAPPRFSHDDGITHLWQAGRHTPKQGEEDHGAIRH